MRAILMYHSIDSTGSAISVTAEAFRRHVRWLASAQVRVVDVAELLELPAEDEAVALTFDDGFESFGALAAPLLEEHGFTATVFVVSQRVGTTNAWEPAGGSIPNLALMGWDELGRLAERGFQVGAHTRTHPRLTDVSDDRMRDEVAGSAEDIATELGVLPLAFAYPYGACDEAVEAVAGDSFPLACSTDLDVLGEPSRRTRLPRLDMYYYRDPARLDAWGTRRFQWHLTARQAGRKLRQRLRKIS
jgi:peptidoglycan/xylan/chitin deacetylase (PgdA/CDA1 family)